MIRYAAALARLELDRPGNAGLGILIVPPCEHAAVAEAIRVALPDATVAPLDAWPVGWTRLVVPGLPTGEQRAIEALITLNEQRDRIAREGRLLVLLVTRRESELLRRHAGDVFSAHRFEDEVAFVARDDVDETRARGLLHEYYRRRFGQLNLRGFARSEREDVSWRVEALYQEIRGRREPVPEATRGPREHSISGPVRELVTLSPLSVLLGQPGAGKSFFLRHLALELSRVDSGAGLERPLPVLVPVSALAPFSDPRPLEERLVDWLLEEGLEIAHAYPRALAEGRVVFLLDGLDEVGGELARRKAVEAVAALSRRAPQCRVIVTSRVTGYEPGALPALELQLEPFDDTQITSFLKTWCALYAIELAGRDDASTRELGERDGRELAAQVLAHEQVRELARTPLLLTILAVVHRAGVRLPDHRVELYEHATRILVERWSRVRSEGPTPNTPPLKSADAVRLLGRVALDIIENGSRGAVSEARLRGLLARAMKASRLPGLESPDQAVDRFRHELGLLVEQGPGRYAFLHLTFAEYFAAWELVRSREIGLLADDPDRLFRPELREVVLLAAGILGVVRADDVALEELVRKLVAAAKRRGDADAGRLLLGLLADGLPLDDAANDAVVEALVPALLTRREEDFLGLVSPRDLLRACRQPRGDVLRRRVHEAFSAGPLLDAIVQLPNPGISAAWLIRQLDAAGIPWGDLARVVHERVGRSGLAFPSVSWRCEPVAVEPDATELRFWVSRDVAEWLTTSTARISFIGSAVPNRDRGFVDLLRVVSQDGDRVLLAVCLEGRHTKPMDLTLFIYAEPAEPARTTPRSRG